MSLKNALRELSFPLDTEETDSKRKKSTKPKVISRKYGQVKLLRNMRHKNKSNTKKSWKNLPSSGGLKPEKKKPDLPKPAYEPRTDLANLGKTLLRSRRKLVYGEPPQKTAPKPKSIFEEKDFKALAQDLRKIFTS